MIQILQNLKDPKLWELWYIPYYGYSAGFVSSTVGFEDQLEEFGNASEVRGLCPSPYNLGGSKFRGP